MNFRKRFQDQQLGFQMAPMVDIMFILLIFFMAASLFAQWEKAMDIVLPTADSGIRDVRQRELIININEEGAIFINGIEKSQADLQRILAQVADVFRNQPVIIRADRNTRHGDVIKVLDICRRVDIRNVAFATLQPQDGKGTPNP